MRSENKDEQKILEEVDRFLEELANKDPPNAQVDYRLSATKDGLIKQGIKVTVTSLKKDYERKKAEALTKKTQAEREAKKGKDVIVLSNKETAQVDQLLSDPDVYNKILAILGKEIKGEAKEKIGLGYLTALSAKLEKEEGDPANGIILKDEASGGKSHYVRTILKLFPKNMQIILGGATATSFKYGEPDYIDDDGRPVIDLSGKILWFMEETGGIAAYNLLKPILSRDKDEIEMQMTNKNAKGQNFQQKIVFRGCPAFFACTTRTWSMKEMDARTFTLSLTSTPEQTENIVNYKAKKKSHPDDARFGIPDSEVRIVSEVCNRLDKHRVWIPFAELIVFENYNNLRLRRDVGKVHTLIEACALLYQKQRKTVTINGKKFLIANLQDLKIIEQICKTELVPTFTGLSKPLIDFYEELQRAFLPGFSELSDSNFKTPLSFSKKNIANATRYAEGTATRYCNELRKVGYLVTARTEGRLQFFSYREGNEAVPTNLRIRKDAESIRKCREEKVNWLIERGVEDKLAQELLEEIFSLPEKEILILDENKAESPLFTQNNSSLPLLLVNNSIPSPFPTHIEDADFEERKIIFLEECQRWSEKELVMHKCSECGEEASCNFLEGKPICKHHFIVVDEEKGLFKAWIDQEWIVGIIANPVKIISFGAGENPSYPAPNYIIGNKEFA